jgi:hypothetical protein
VVGPSFRLLDELLADMRAHVSLAALQLSAAMGAPDRAAADSRVVRAAGTR